jgi:hypothetical protein
MPNKRVRRSKITYAALSVETLLHVLQYWDGFIEVQNPNNYLSLFGRKGDQILQFFDRISYCAYMEKYNAGIQKVNDCLYPFKFVIRARITAVRVCSHYSEDFWLGMWRSVREIVILCVNINTLVHTKQEHFVTHTKRIIDECKSWEALRSFTIESLGFNRLDRNIQKLFRLTSLTITINMSTRGDWKKMFKNINRLSNLKSLTISFIPPDGSYMLPVSLRYLHLKYRKRGTGFSVIAPCLHSIELTQLYKTGSFDVDVTSILTDFRSSNLHTVAVNFNLLDSVSSVLSVNVIPSSVTSYRIQCYANCPVDWFKEGQIKLRSLEIDVPVDVLAIVFDQVKYQENLEVLTLHRLDIKEGTLCFMKHLPKLRLLHVLSGVVQRQSVHDSQVPSHVVLQLGSSCRFE